MTPGQHIAILCNPLAGTGKALLLSEKIVDALRGENISFALFQQNWPDDLSVFTNVWIVGGDGTLNYFINRYPGIKLPLVIFKGGTGNDVHWLMYGDKTFEEQFAIALSAEPKLIDAGQCNEKLFINGAGIGFEGEIARSLTGKKKLPGKTSFMMAILKKIFFYRSQTYRIKSEDFDDLKSQLMISVTNGRRAGGGFHIAPVAEINDGWLDMVLIDPLSPLSRLRYLPVIEKGKHLRLPFVHHCTLKKIVIESEKMIQCHLDGEYYPSEKLEIEILPGRFLFRY